MALSADDELNNLYVGVHYLPGNSGLLVNYKTAKILSESAIAELRRLGIRCRIEPIEGLGFDAYSFFQIALDLLKHGRLIGLMIFFIRHGLRLLKNPFIKTVNREQPSYVVFVAARLRGKLGSDEFYGPVADRLVHMKYVTQYLAEFLAKQYPIFEFDQQLKISIAHSSFRTHLFQPNRHATPFSNGRIIRHLRSIKETNNTQLDYSFYKFGLIRLDISNTKEESGGWMTSGSHKSYYFYLSNRVIGRLRKPKEKLSSP